MTPPKKTAPSRDAAKRGAKGGKAKPSAKPSVKPSVAQPHGGALIPGAGGGPQPGSGRPPSVLRDQLRGSYGDRMAFLDRVIDGEVMQKVELPLFAILPHAACPNCGELGLEPLEPAKALLLTFEAKASATVKDRLSALEHQAKYGLGALKEVSVENVRDRVAKTLDVIRQHTSPEQAVQIVSALRPVWV